MKTSRKVYFVMTPLEHVMTDLQRYVSSHPTPCHCSPCHALLRVRAMLADEARATKALTKAHTILEIMEEDATEAKHDKRNHNEPEMWYQQGKADAYRIAMLTMREEYRRADVEDIDTSFFTDMLSRGPGQ
jgi:hypothetical protein